MNFGLPCEECREKIKGCMNGTYFSDVACNFAVCKGHLGCLKYAHENGCSWNKLTCSYAAENGYLNCLKYAHENEFYQQIHLFQKS